VLIHFLALAALYHSYILAYFPGQFFWLGTLLVIILVGYFTSRNFKVISLFVVLACLPVVVHQDYQEERASFPFQKIDLDLTVQAVSDGVHKEWGVKGRFRIVRVDDCEAALEQLCSELVNKEVELNDYRSGAFNAGHTYQAIVRLKPPLGFLNPGGFDYEHWLFSKNIWAKGYFKQEPLLIGDHLDLAWNHRMGRFLDDLVSAQCYSEMASSDECVNQLRSKALLEALILADKQNLQQDERMRLAEAGLIHLFVISGLHIGLLFGVVWWLLKLFLSFVFLNSFVVSPKFQQLLTKLSECLPLAFVWWFVVQIDYPVPALRAAIFISVWIFARILGWQLHLLHVLSFSVWLILSLMPEELFSYGFWMSMLAVLALSLAMSFTRYDAFSAEAKETQARIFKGFKAKLWVMCKAQVFVVLLLLPFSIYFGNQVSILALIWNLVLIPMFGLLVVPLLLFASLVFQIFPDLSSLLLGLIGQSLLTTIDFIHEVNGFGFLQGRLGLRFSYPEYFVFFWLILCLSPVSRKLKVIGIVGVSSLLVLKPEQKTDLELWFLDVGQGQSIALINNGQAILYDTGFKSGNFTAAESVIIPFLRYKNVEAVDLLVVSHKDTDHSGGMKTLLESDYQPKRLMQNFNDVSFQGIETMPCIAGSVSNWFDLRLKVLWPVSTEELSELSSNDSSCVILIEYGSRSILLTGDVTKLVETRLLEQYPDLLRKGITFMSVPHHGSKSSSSNAFISALKPKWSIASTGPLNRFGHPHDTVVSRYIDLGIHFVNTAVSGAIGFEIRPEGDVELVSHKSPTSEFYWRTARQE